MTAIYTLNEENFVTSDDQEITICLMRDSRFAGGYFYELSVYDEGKNTHVEVYDESPYIEYLEGAILSLCEDYPEAISDLMEQMEE